MAQPIRLLLAYSGTEYEDKRYNIGPAPDFDRSEWLNDKQSLGLDFPNVIIFISKTLIQFIINFLIKYFEIIII